MQLTKLMHEAAMQAAAHKADPVKLARRLAAAMTVEQGYPTGLSNPPGIILSDGMRSVGPQPQIIGVAPGAKHGRKRELVGGVLTREQGAVLVARHKAALAARARAEEALKDAKMEGVVVGEARKDDMPGPKAEKVLSTMRSLLSRVGLGLRSGLLNSKLVEAASSMLSELTTKNDALDMDVPTLNQLAMDVDAVIKAAEDELAESRARSGNKGADVLFAVASIFTSVHMVLEQLSAWRARGYSLEDRKSFMPLLRDALYKASREKVSNPNELARALAERLRAEGVPEPAGPASAAAPPRPATAGVGPRPRARSDADVAPPAAPHGHGPDAPLPAGTAMRDIEDIRRRLARKRKEELLVEAAGVGVEVPPGSTNRQIIDLIVARVMAGML